jgi:G:T-mismatch repair DNA endonuclease (very short patch repair protein)
VLAEQQHGAFSIGQAVGLGFDPSTVRKRAARGTYTRLHRGVYAVAGAPATWRRSACGLVLAVPGLAAASHKTAAYLWEMTSIEPKRAEIVTVRHERIVRRHPQIHESKDLIERDIVTVNGIPTTTAVRTIVDLGASASHKYVEHCLDTALRTHLFTVADVRRFIARVARSGRNGIGTIRPLIEERIGWNTLTESPLEDLFRRLVSKSGLPMPVEQLSVYDGVRFVARPDFAYPDRKIAVELDGARWHMDRASFEGDRRKQNELQAMGWVVYRFTWRQLQDEPAKVLSILASALARSVLA